MGTGFVYCVLLYTNTREFMTQTIELWLDGLDCHVITTEYRTRENGIRMYHLVCNALGPCNLFWSVGSMFSYNTNTVLIYLYIFCNFRDGRNVVVKDSVVVNYISSVVPDRWSHKAGSPTRNRRKGALLWR